jgi:acetolactate synthase-1/3 small subunit
MDHVICVPIPEEENPMRQTIIAIVENKPGVLNRIASLFRRRNFNIDSLNVGRTENPNVSRMTLVVDSGNAEARLVEANLYKLVNVIDVQDVTGLPAVLRELAMIKVAASPDQRTEIISLANVFKAKIVDVGAESLIMQITATDDRVDSLVELLRPWGIVELVRTGHVAMMRGMAEGVRHTPGAGPLNQNGNGHTVKAHA